MIEGLKIDVTSDELRRHLQERHGHHREKVVFYERQVAAFADQTGAANLHATNNPIQSLSQSAQQHREKAAFYAFVAEHVVPDEVYRLNENDLLRLEIFDRYY